MTNSHVYSVKDLMFLPPDEYVCKASENIRSMMNDQIKRNIARNGLYSLHYILSEVEAGCDSFSIVENLKQFFFEMAKVDPEIAKQAESAMHEHEKYVKESLEKIKPGN